jgi:hypothetical protein
MDWSNFQAVIKGLQEEGASLGDITYIITHIDEVSTFEQAMTIVQKRQSQRDTRKYSDMHFSGIMQG